MTTYQIERASLPIRSIGVSEYRQFVFNFTGQTETLDLVTTITGNDARGKALGVTEASGVLTIGTAAINTVAVIVDKRTVIIGKAVTVFVSAPSGVVGTVYTLTCRAVTTTGQTVEQIGYLRVE